jgi:hypothetical protein
LTRRFDRVFLPLQNPRFPHHAFHLGNDIVVVVLDDKETRA